MQTIVAAIGGTVERLQIPDPDEILLDRVIWGDHTVLFSPAYWKTLSWLDSDQPGIVNRLGETMAEEVAACLLGGYGIPSEVGLAAFYRLKSTGSLTGLTSEHELRQLLAEPLCIGERKLRYRFARQKARYLHQALRTLADSDPPKDDELAFRNWLLLLPGIGLKTASWITRNWLDSDRVAIIDIHIYRAGLLMNLFSVNQTPARDYLRLEDLFVKIAQRLNIRTSQLDSLIWREMKSAGNIPLREVRRLVS